MKVFRSTTGLGAAVVALAIALALTGCARKSTETPPEPTPAPPTSQNPTPTPADTTTPAPPSPGDRVFSAGDLQPVFFDFDAYSLRDDGRAALDANAKLLRDHAEARVVIEGHCDERGTVEYNQALGERRAQSAKDYIVQAGISSQRIQVISYGKERPFDTGHDEAAWAKNRRAHFALQ